MNLAVTPERIMDAKSLFDAMVECCNPERAELLKDKLHEYAMAIFMGEKNADVYMALIMFTIEHALGRGDDEQVDPLILALAMQLGLQDAVKTLTTEPGELD